MGIEWRIRRIAAFCKLSFLLLFLVGLPLFLFLKYPEIFTFFRSKSALDDYLEGNMHWLPPVYLLLHILQVAIPFLPGQLVQFAGGYLFGVLPSYLLSLVGIGIGTVISYYIARFLGHSACCELFGKQKMEQYCRRLEQGRSKLLLFILYLIPGIPKDLIVYAAGCAGFPLPSLLLISLAGRSPVMLGSLLIGALTRNENYGPALFLSVLAVAGFLLCIWKRKELMAWGESLQEKRGE